MKFSDDANLQNVFFKFLFHIKKLRVATFTISFAIPISYNFFKIFFTLLTSRRKKKKKIKVVWSNLKKENYFKETKNCANTYISNFMYIVRRILFWTSISKSGPLKSRKREARTTSFRVLYFAYMYILTINRFLLEPRKIEIFAGDAISTNDSFALCVYDRRENAFHDWTAYSTGSNCNCTCEHERKRGWQLAWFHCLRLRMRQNVTTRGSLFLLLFVPWFIVAVFIRDKIAMLLKLVPLFSKHC